MKWLERSLLGKCREMCVAGRYIDWVVESVGFFFFFLSLAFMVKLRSPSSKLTQATQIPVKCESS